jgi:hypothetical protein
VARWAAARITNGGDDEKFIAITKDLRDPTIVLDSQGGVVDAVCRIGHVIYIKRYETRSMPAQGAIQLALLFGWLERGPRSTSTRCRSARESPN